MKAWRNCEIENLQKKKAKTIDKNVQKRWNKGKKKEEEDEKTSLKG